MNNEGYSPSNCRWTSTLVQSKNRRNTLLLTIENKTLCLKDWCEEFNMPYKQVHYRIKILNWDYYTALTKPIKEVRHG